MVFIITAFPQLVNSGRIIPMKKQHLSLLVVLTMLFAAFTLGIFIGRNQNHETIYLSQLQTVPVHAVSAEPAASVSSTLPEIVFPIDINSAGLEELCALPGIGETLARRILDHRNGNGPFERPEELMNVAGIGAGKLEGLLDYITTGG